MTAARYIPEGANKISNKSGSAVAYTYTTKGGKLAAIGYIGKAAKPALNYIYGNSARRMASVAQFLAGAEASHNAKIQRAAEKREALANPHSLNVGDVMSCSWGYDQTNVDYFEVTRLVGKRSVELRKIACMSEDTEFMQGVSAPAKGHYIDEPMIKRVDERNAVRIYRFASAYKLEPKKIAGVEVFTPQRWTAYA
jgi:hypothetical protein